MSRPKVLSPITEDRQSRPIRFTAIELCAGAGGQAIGLERAGFEPLVLVDNDQHMCNTLRVNRPSWHVLQEDLNMFDGRPYREADLLAGGLPCPPFSVAGLGRGENDERNLFPAMLRLVDEIRPRVVMVENVPGLMTAKFQDYRTRILKELDMQGYCGEWKLLNACDFGVSQYRSRAILIAVRKSLNGHFEWPNIGNQYPMSVGEALWDLMASKGWRGADNWRILANSIAPTIVGGSLKHGGPDLGPTRAKQAWAKLNVDGYGIADEPPGQDFEGMPRLTVRMVARLQGFPDSWQISGGKTAAYRQIGNAFPPPVAHAVAQQIRQCLVPKQLALTLD